MKKSFILGLLLLAVVTISLYSCMHDDLSSSTDLASKEYSSKSLWKEDEKYIKNVMEIYHEHEAEIKKTSGTPLWDYAMTMDRFDESFLMVPLVENGKVVSVLKVPRHGEKVYFIDTQSQNDIDFFQEYISPKAKRVLNTNLSSETSKIVCATKTVSTWLPDNEANPDPSSGQGHWTSHSTTVCTYQQLENCTGIVLPDGECEGSGSGDGYPYPHPSGGGGSPLPKDPCEKMKTQNANPNFKAKFAALDKPEIFTKDIETGFAAAYGTVPFQQMANSDNGNVRLPDGNKYFGYMHAHLDKEGVVKIFSPYDIITFLTSCVRNAEQSGNMADAYAMVITSQGNYILMYTGDGSYSIGQSQIDNWKSWYDKEFAKIANEDGTFSQDNVEKLFTQFLEQKVNINGLEVYKSDKTTGDTSKMKYNGKDNPVTSTPCP